MKYNKCKATLNEKQEITNVVHNFDTYHVSYKRVSAQHAFCMFHEILLLNLARLLYHCDCRVPIFQEKKIEEVEAFVYTEI